MIDIHAHFDREKDDAGSVMIHAKSSIPDLCTDLEIIIAHIVKGLAMQIPEDSARCFTAAVMFSVAACKGAKRGLNEYMEES